MQKKTSSSPPSSGSSVFGFIKRKPSWTGIGSSNATTINTTSSKAINGNNNGQLKLKQQQQSKHHSRSPTHRKQPTRRKYYLQLLWTFCLVLILLSLLYQGNDLNSQQLQQENLLLTSSQNNTFHGQGGRSLTLHQDSTDLQQQLEQLKTQHSILQHRHSQSQTALKALLQQQQTTGKMDANLLQAWIQTQGLTDKEHEKQQQLLPIASSVEAEAATATNQFNNTDSTTNKNPYDRRTIWHHKPQHFEQKYKDLLRTTPPQHLDKFSVPSVVEHFPRSRWEYSREFHCQVSDPAKQSDSRMWTKLLLPDQAETPRQQRARVSMKSHEQAILCEWKQFQLSNEPRRQIAYVFHGQSHFQHEYDGNITLVAQCSVDRLKRLSIHRNIWRGPMSVAVYISSLRDIRKFFDFLTSKYKTALERTAFHLLLEKQVEANSDEHYPHNILRNMALNFSDTQYVLNVDMDFMITPASYRSLRRLLKTNTAVNRALKEKTLLVLPAFEYSQKGDRFLNVPDEWIPSNKTVLLKHVIKLKTIEPFHIHRYPQGHSPTNYGRWFRSNSSSTTATEVAPIYFIDYAEFFEPYVVAQRNVGLPWFWQGFRGFGWNKMSWFKDLHAMDFKFAVLRDYYCFHLGDKSEIKFAEPLFSQQKTLFTKYLLHKRRWFQRNKKDIELVEKYRGNEKYEKTRDNASIGDEHNDESGMRKATNAERAADEAFLDTVVEEEDSESEDEDEEEEDDDDDAENEDEKEQKESSQDAEQAENEGAKSSQDNADEDDAANGDADVEEVGVAKSDDEIDDTSEGEEENGEAVDMDRSDSRKQFISRNGSPRERIKRHFRTRNNREQVR